MPELAVQTPCIAEASDVPLLAASLAAAFAGYPLTEWVVLPDARRTRRRHAYFEIFLDHGVAHGEVLCPTDRSAAAIWYPPAGWNASLATLLARLPRLARVTGWRNLASRLTQLARLAAHHPDDPHWYLEVIGTRPDAQGRGTGGLLLEAGLARARADGVGAYLMTSSAAVIPFYSAHGFVVREEFAIRRGPTCWCLWHDR